MSNKRRTKRRNPYAEYAWSRKGGSMEDRRSRRQKDKLRNELDEDVSDHLHDHSVGERVQKCLFCGTRMHETDESYAENPYCRKCYDKRVEILPLILTSKSAARVLDLLENPREPTQELKDLFKDTYSVTAKEFVSEVEALLAEGQ